MKSRTIWYKCKYCAIEVQSWEKYCSRKCEVEDKKSRGVSRPYTTGNADVAGAAVGVVAVLAAAGIAHVINFGEKPAIRGVCLVASKKHNMNVKTVRIYTLIGGLFLGGYLAIILYYYYSRKWKDEIAKLTPKTTTEDNK